MSARGKAPILFEGPPTALTAEPVVDISPEPTAAPVIEVGEERYPLVLRPVREGRASMSFALPPTTPPGSLEASVHVADRAYPALIRVRERQGVLFEPRALEAGGAPGSQIVADVQVKNVGNVPLALVTEENIELRKSGAIARGVEKAFKETRGDLVSRLIVLGKRLQAESVRRAPVAYQADFSTLGVGETRSVGIHIRVPEDLEPSESWAGTLPILGAGVSITLHVSRGPRRQGAGSDTTREGA